MSNVFVFRQLPPGVINEYFGGGGKGGTTTSSQTVSIPPEVLARYNAVNARAEGVAQQPFQQYGGEFVAPLTPTQTAGIQGTNVAANQAQPYYGAATGAAFAGAMPVNPGGLQVGQYMNPFTQSVVGATQAAMGQQQGQQLAQQQAESIRAGAFGGDRAGLQRQALRGQQGLAQAQAIAPLYQQGYQQALQTAQQQQGVGLGAAQANRQAVQQLSQQLGGLGTGAQQAALQGAQAQMAAGQVQQQTQQAQDTAQYQQFLQERGYPFQVAQFLANIAMGTGALSGSTTSGTQTAPGGFFSDKRLKDDVKEIGETHDGQPIYSYKYKGDDRTQIGLMAQDVEKKHPEAVGVMGGYKTVDYKKATEDAERTHKDMGGGLMPDGFDYNSMGGAVTSDMAGEGFERGGYVGGGLVGNDDWAQIIAANKQALGVYGGQQPLGGAPGATGIVPAANIPVPKPIEAAKMSMPAQRPSGMSTAFQTGRDIASTYKGGKEALLGSAADKSAGLIGGGGSTSGKSVFGEFKDWWNTPSAAHGGLIVPRYAYADGGETDNEVAPYDPSETMRGEDPMKDVLASGSRKYEMLKPGQMSTPGGGGGGSALGSIASGIGAAKGIMEAGSWLGSTALPFLAGLSDARAKDNIRPVGKTFDGQNIYSYNIGEGPTQMGLMAQEVLDRKPEAVGRRGEYLTVDYDRATEDATPYAYGGLVPRQGYATRGGTDVPADYSPEADMPSPNAQEAGLVPGDAPKYLISPQNREDMDPHWQSLINRIYGGEGGYDKSGQPRYNIRQGGKETFDIEAGHPGKRPAQGGVSSASGAGQFINDTWNRVTGGAPMTKGYQDAATKELAAQDYKARTGRELDADLREKGLAPDIIKTLAPTWTSLGNAPSPPGLVGRGMQAAASSPGAEGKKSIGDVVTSEGFIVPALGFLGSMLASNRPNLGQALGEGIMGGVGAYQGQQKQLADIAKTKAETGQMLPVATARNIEAANKLAVGLMQYNASLPPGSKKLTLQEYAKVVGYTGPIPPSPEQTAQSVDPGAGNIASTDSRKWGLTPDEKESLVIKYPDGTAIPAYNDPSYLKAYANKFTSMGEGWAKEQADAASAAAEKNKVQTFDISGKLVTVPGAIEAGQKQKVGERLAEEAAEFNKEAAKYGPESQKIIGALNELETVLSQFRTGADAPARANLDRVMKAIDPENKFKLASSTAGDYDTVVKDAMFIGLSQLAGLSPRAPASELNAIRQTIPDVRLDPDAIRNIISKIKGDTAYKQKMYDAFDIDKNVNITKFQKEFMRDNPYDEFLKKTKAELRPGVGTQQQREQSAAPQSSEALQWARSNPEDPRSAEILKRLGVK